ncbi:hypothetical protein JJB11_19880 [Ramlibacter ginsenosidimutans]|uniref:Uncharacterized protein n=1 Tax=Ramlibacter ginsenosidimutans TaxID=502333 RepID=A0A934WPQ7_9BURK|nr:hypothetical protein [Ramlibacter ginsenosidimutans]MBK6008372.1 hypothetical protein [Ramlibacter ginsenosidimutans]
MTRVAVVGAGGTGRSSLVAELARFFSDRGLDIAVLEDDAGADVVLLAGLDLPSARGAEAEDASIRTRLQSAGVAFHVVYGTGPERLRSALQALASAGVLAAGLVQREDDGAEERRPWTWSCEKCSDPDCEHRLFTRLREARG